MTLSGLGAREKRGGGRAPRGETVPLPEKFVSGEAVSGGKLRATGEKKHILSKENRDAPNDSRFGLGKTLVRRSSTRLPRS